MTLRVPASASSLELDRGASSLALFGFGFLKAKARRIPRLWRSGCGRSWLWHEAPWRGGPSGRPAQRPPPSGPAVLLAASFDKAEQSARGAQARTPAKILDSETAKLRQLQSEV